NALPTCTGGTCGFACVAPFANCDGNATNGCETNTGTDVSNCGGCGIVCPPRANATATCTAGSCGFVCNAGFANCDANAANGCESDTTTAPDNCGGCNRVCSRNRSAARTCTAGGCSGTCNTGFADSNANKATDGCETNTNTDVNNCGSCGIV